MRWPNSGPRTCDHPKQCEGNSRPERCQCNRNEWERLKGSPLSGGDRIELPNGKTLKL